MNQTQPVKTNPFKTIAMQLNGYHDYTQHGFPFLLSIMYKFGMIFSIAESTQLSHIFTILFQNVLPVQFWMLIKYALPIICFFNIFAMKSQLIDSQLCQVGYFALNLILKILIMVKQQLEAYNSKVIFIYVVIELVGVVFFVAQMCKYLWALKFQPQAILCSLIIWMQIVLVASEQHSSSSFAYGLLLGNFYATQKFITGSLNLYWTQFQTAITILLIGSHLIYNMWAKMVELIDSLLFIAIIVFIAILFVCEFRISAKEVQMAKDADKSELPLQSPSNINSAEKSPKASMQNSLQSLRQPERDREKLIIPLVVQHTANQKWDYLIEKAIDNWYFTVAYRKETKQLEIDKINAPMDNYLTEKQIGGLDLLNRVRSLQLNTALNYSFTQSQQIEQDQSLHQILLQWFEDETFVNADRKGNKSKSFQNEEAVVGPFSSNRDKANSKSFVKQNTNLSRKSQVPNLSKFFERQPSIASQINQLPESRMKLEGSFQSLFAKSDLSLLMQRPTNKGKQYLPCVLALDDNTLLYLSVSIITYDKSESSQADYETAVIIENNHIQVLQNMQLINVSARLNISNSFIVRQSEEDQTLLKRILNERDSLKYKPGSLSGIPPPGSSNEQLKFTTEMGDVEQQKQQTPVQNSSQPGFQGFSFCNDVIENETEGMKRASQVRENTEKQRTQKEQFSREFASMHHSKHTTNTLTIPYGQAKRRDEDTDTPLKQFKRSSSGDFVAKLSEQLRKQQDEHLDRLHTLLQMSFVMINNSYNYFDCFADSNHIKRTSFKLDQVVQNVLDILKYHDNAVNYKIDLKLVNRLTEPLITSDKRKIKQIFTNLVLNSLQSIQSYDEHNQVIVQLQDDGKLKAGLIYVTITDNGKGLTQEHLELQRIMEARFGLLCVERALQLLSPKPPNFSISNLNTPTEPIVTGCQASFKLYRRVKLKQHEKPDDQPLQGFVLQESQKIDYH